MNLPPHQIVRRRGLGKEYTVGKFHSSPVMNFPDWLEWSMKSYARGVSREDFDLQCQLTGDNRAKFKQLFGKCSFTYNGSHYFHCWYIHLPTTDLIILTAKEHGTCYEVVTKIEGKDIPTDQKAVFSFMDALKVILRDTFGPRDPELRAKGGT